MVLPLINFAGVAVEYLYRLVGYEHPEAHQLLNALQNPGSRLAQWGLILGATVAAPLFEEMLFRGHLQTLLRRGFAHLRDRAAGAGAAMPAAFAAPGYLPQAVPLPGVAQPGVPHPSFPEHAPQAYGPTARGPFAGSPQPPSMPYAAPGAYRPVPAGPPPVWASWAAIVLTSVAFALVHEAWTWPLIFLLSLCLGYAYERTSNLWVPITIHALFNTVSTVVYYVTYVQPN
jgi:membrane protease YdiL (CAAX protease family)